MALKEKRFMVRGSGHFPLDMLRYDRCYPAGQDDVSKVAEGPELRSVNVTAPYGALTVARWASFGWSVL
jgi:hypothetical protein